MHAEKGAYRRYVAELVPANSEELERVDQVSNNRHIPETKDDDRHRDYLEQRY